MREVTIQIGKENSDKYILNLSEIQIVELMDTISSKFHLQIEKLSQKANLETKLATALQEVELINSGKISKKTAREFLDELD